jgi:hypothetical protein
VPHGAEIKPVELTPEEIDLFKKMEADFSKNSGYTGEAASFLMNSWVNVRQFQRLEFVISLNHFPEDAGNLMKTFLEAAVIATIYLSLCTSWNICDISFLVPRFLPPPLRVFGKILIEDLGTSGELMDQLCAFVRAEVRKLKLCCSCRS